MILIATKPRAQPERSGVSLLSLTYIRNGGKVQTTAVVEVDGVEQTYDGVGTSVENVFVEKMQGLMPGITVISHQAKKVGKGNAPWKVTVAAKYAGQVEKAVAYHADANLAGVVALIVALNRHRELRSL